MKRYSISSSVRETQSQTTRMSYHFMFIKMALKKMITWNGGEGAEKLDRSTLKSCVALRKILSSLNLFLQLKSWD